MMYSNRIDVINFINNIYPIIHHNSYVTENFFVHVQNNPTGLIRYKALANKYGTYSLNTSIGYLIRNLYALPNSGRRKATRTTLIKSFESH